MNSSGIGGIPKTDTGKKAELLQYFKDEELQICCFGGGKKSRMIRRLCSDFENPDAAAAFSGSFFQHFFKQGCIHIVRAGRSDQEASRPEQLHAENVDILVSPVGILDNEPKRVAVIGGGIGGMETARIAAMRGHKVTIYEKTELLGGVFLAAAAPSFKEKDRELIEWYKRQIIKLPIEVRLKSEVKDIAALNADKIVIATGGTPKRISVPGAEKTIEACEYLLGKKETGETVVVVGGGLTGCEIAYDLYLKGRKPILVEMKNDLIPVRGRELRPSEF